MADIKNKQIFALNLKNQLNIHGKVPTDLIDDLDIKKATVYSWLNGQTFPRIDKIELLAGYFGITKSDLVEDKTETNKKSTSDEPVDLDKALSEEGMAMFDGQPLSEEYKRALLAMLNTMKDNGK
ncbi:helix-turn-helix domain-containing protein [Weissella sagaensis]|uniref:helix-turn-helix domain-containing protein n=1 Tax=Weissella sagaensis TaxID=2559928 RepID=UPI0013EE1651|nr:helix-turn-helix transcriptional regulator [Weissella sagaensis]UEG66197.1 XRE family transcriptional regulator [Weissella hellenica]